MIKPHKLVETTRSSKKVFDGGLLQVYKDEVNLPDGETSYREWIDHPGACAILPVHQNGEVVLLSQYRYPIKQIFYEVPAGKIDPGEDPLHTVERELEEEAGVTAKHVEYTGHFYPAIGYANEIIHLFIAWQLDIQPNNVDDDEFVEPFRIPFRQAISMVENGEITDGKTMACIWKAMVWWRKNEPFKLELG